MSTLRQTIEAHAVQFASAIVQALRGASLDELMTIAGGQTGAPPRGRPRGRRAAKTNGASPKATNNAGRLGRRSADEIGRTLDKIVAVLSQHPEGLRAEQIKAALQLDKRELPKPIAAGLQSGVLKKSGQKRATIYTLGTGRKRS